MRLAADASEHDAERVVADELATAGARLLKNVRRSMTICRRDLKVHSCPSCPRSLCDHRPAVKAWNRAMRQLRSRRSVR